MELMVSRSKINQIFTYIFFLAFGVFYLIIPLFLTDLYPPEICYKVSFLAFLSMIGFYAGLNLYSSQTVQRKKIVIKYSHFSAIVFLLFFATVTVIVITSKSIPLVDALSGKGQADLILSREEFLKKREGWEASLAYIISSVDTTFLPFVVVYGFYIKSRQRFLFLGLFVLYSISFLEKAYFLKVAIPLFALLFYQAKNKKRFLIIGGSCILAAFLGMFMISGFGSIEVAREDPFFSILHIPTTLFGIVFWRIVGVPVATVLDAVNLFTYGFHEYFYGATSGFLAFLSGNEKVNFERILYFSQFGGGGYGNANTAYFIEAFINFGYVGVLVFSVIIGKLIRFILLTKDIVLVSIMLLFIYNLFNTGLIGNLLSNGFLLFFIFAKFIKIK